MEGFKLENYRNINEIVFIDLKASKKDSFDEKWKTNLALKVQNGG